MDLIEKYIGEGKVKYDLKGKIGLFSDDDWMVYDEHTGEISKLVKNRGKKMNINKHFTSSKHAGVKIGYAKKNLKWLFKNQLGENILAQIGSIGKMPGQWGERLGTFGTVLAKALKDAGVEVHGIEPIGKFDNEITVSYKGKKKKVKLTGSSSAAKVVKKITGK